MAAVLVLSCVAAFIKIRFSTIFTAPCSPCVYTVCLYCSWVEHNVNSKDLKAVRLKQDAQDSGHSQLLYYTIEYFTLSLWRNGLESMSIKIHSKHTFTVKEEEQYIHGPPPNFICKPFSHTHHRTSHQSVTFSLASSVLELTLVLSGHHVMKLK